jgi:hypothetical protein
LRLGGPCVFGEKRIPREDCDAKLGDDTHRFGQ